MRPPRLVWLPLSFLLAPAFAGQIDIHVDLPVGEPTAVTLPAQMPLSGQTISDTALTSVVLDLRLRGVEVAPHADVQTQTTLTATQLPQSAVDGAQTASASPLAFKGEATRSANVLTGGIASAAHEAGGGQAKIRETVGAAFDGTARLQRQTVEADASPVTAGELFGADQRYVVAPKDQTRLATLADQTARLRAVRAVRGESALSAEDAAVLRGIDDLARAVAITRTTPAQLAAAARVVEGMDIEKLRRFSKLADAFINTDVDGKSSPGARIGNVEHVQQQLIEPLAQDGAALAEAFKTDSKQSSEHFVEMLRALQYATDTGKQQNPDDMKAALARFNSQVDTGPNWYINNFILPHEYASIQWAEILGRRAGMNGREVLAFQRLIANHNFGPDLTDPKNAGMRDHWWPKNFREQTLPMMRAMGLDVDSYFSRDEKGVLQYNNTQGHPYALLLSAYDRAIAVGKVGAMLGNGNGLATWKKYGTQDFNGKKGRLKAIRQRNAAKGPGELLEPDPPGAKDEEGKAGPIFEFDGPSIIRAMESTADWAEQHVESLWASLYAALPADSPVRKQYPTARLFRRFPPYFAQRRSIGELNAVLRLVKADNPEGQTSRADVVPGSGVAYYEARSKELAGVYRVTLARVGPGAFDPRSVDYDYEARLEVSTREGWKTPEAPVPAVKSADPVALLLDLIRKDKGW